MVPRNNITKFRSKITLPFSEKSDDLHLTLTLTVLADLPSTVNAISTSPRPAKPRGNSTLI
jgi:hypothetical protein